MSEYKFDFEGESVRLDTFVAEAAGISRSRAAAIISEGLVFVNGKPSGKSVKLFKGDSVDVTLPAAKPYRAEPQDIPLF